MTIETNTAGVLALILIMTLVTLVTRFGGVFVMTYPWEMRDISHSRLGFQFQRKFLPANYSFGLQVFFEPVLGPFPAIS